MDLVDIDKVLDDLEEIENNSAPPPSSSRLHSDPSSSNRRIKVRSVLSSLNDYLDYESKLPDKSPSPDVVSTAIGGPQQSGPSGLCEQTAAGTADDDDAKWSRIDNVNKAVPIDDNAGNSIRINSSSSNSSSTAEADNNEQPPKIEQIAAVPGNTPTSIAPQESSNSAIVSSLDSNATDKPVVPIETNTRSADCTTPPPSLEVEAEATPGTNSTIDCDSNASSTASSHVTLSPVAIENVADPQPVIATSENIKSSEEDLVPERELAQPDDEDDLEKYLDDLVTEYDKTVQTAKSVVEDSQREEEIKGHSTVSEAVLEESTNTSKVNSETVPKGEQTIVRKKSPGDSGKSTELPKETSDEVSRSAPPPPPADVDQELNMDELRELEKLIQQQELEEQMELDRQMALKLQEDDLEALSVDQSTSTATPATPALVNPPPITESSGDSSPVSPLEAPRSTTAVRPMDDDPEFQHLLSLGKTAPYWVPDTTHDSCMQCDQKFSLLKRRHHCRCCGELLCATCCSFRANLDYMREQQQLLAAASASSSSSPSSSSASDWPEARICTKCDKLVQRRDELLQLRYLAECGIGEDSGLAEFPIKGVLKKPKAKTAAGEEDGDEDEAAATATDNDNSDSTATPTKTVIFSDGIRPGHDDFSAEDSSQRSRRRTKRPVTASAPIHTADSQPVTIAQEVQSPSESEVVARALNSYKAFVTALKTFYVPQNQSYLPPIKTSLPPVLRHSGGFLPSVELKNDFGTCLELCDYLKTERRDFMIQKRLTCAVKIIDYRVDANQMDNQCRWCLNVTTNGMSWLGQQEFVVLIEMNPEYLTSEVATADDLRNLKFLLLLIRRLFVHFNKIYSRIHMELDVEMRAKRKMEVAQLQHPDPSFFLLDNRVAVAPFSYFNKKYVPLLGNGRGGTAATPEPDTNGNESDESQSNYICDKYAFLKSRNRFIDNMDLQRVTLGTKGDPDFYLDFNAMLYVRASPFQSTQNVIMPDRNAGQVLFGLLVKNTEIPWAKLFPLRLLLRMGAEHRLYPWPLFNALDRKCLYSEFVDNSIIHFLADFRNFSFTLNEIPGLHLHMEHEKVLPDATKEDNVRVRIYLPKINYKRIEAMINDSSESILSFAGGLNQKADGHLVCIQQQGEENNRNASGSTAYSTQSLNIDRDGGVGVGAATGPSKTGLNFFILNGALKSSATGLKAKLSIIEDGIMVQVLPGIMAQVRSALLEMRNFEIRCEDNVEKVTSTGTSEKKEMGSATSEVIEFIWTSVPVIETIIGLKSEIDERSMECCSYVNMICDYHKRAEAGKIGQSRSGMFGLRSGNSRLEMDCFYLHLHRVVLYEEENYFSLFNEKMVEHLTAEQAEGGSMEQGENDASEENANLIKSLNVTNWEVPSINFLIKLAAILGRTTDRALSKHYSRLYEERLRQVGVRFHFQPDHIVTFEAGSRGTKLPMVYMNDLDSHLIPMLHHILELNAKDAPNVLPFTSNNKNGVGANNGLGQNLSAEFLDRIGLLQNLQRAVTFELVFDIAVDLP